MSEAAPDRWGAPARCSTPTLDARSPNSDWVSGPLRVVAEGVRGPRVPRMALAFVRAGIATAA